MFYLIIIDYIPANRRIISQLNIVQKPIKPAAIIVLVEAFGSPEVSLKELIHCEDRAVVDVIEAMPSHRPYRPALSIEKTLDQIRGGCEEHMVTKSSRKKKAGRMADHCRVDDHHHRLHGGRTTRRPDGGRAARGNGNCGSGCGNLRCKHGHQTLPAGTGLYIQLKYQWNFQIEISGNKLYWYCRT